MNERQDLVRRLATTGAEALAPDSSALAGRRLGIAAAVTGTAHVVYLVLYRTVWLAQSNAVGFATGLLGLAASALVAAHLLRGERPAARVAAIGIGYEILLSLTLGLSEARAVSYDAASTQVSWAAVVIVFFPFLLPARPAVVLGASLASAATTPLAMAIVFAATQRPWPEPGIVASFVIPPFVCAMLVWAPTRVLSQLTAAVQRARRLGNYELTARLGAGGMGEVWLARHRLLARPAAVKLIRPEMLGAKDAGAREHLLRRFEREAQVTASLDSPHTVELYDFGVSSDGALFYVMELLHGVDLETLVQRYGPLPSERVAHLLMQACDSLEDAHGRGLIHRDIKPANLFVSRKGGAVDFVKLLDFGLVKRWNHDEGDDLASSLAHTGAAVGKTDVGQIVGTPAFLAPEAAIGEGAVDHRADIYALGCVGYWMLTGQFVFAESTLIAMAVAHISKAPEAPSARTDQPVDRRLEAILMSCLHKDRDRRPSSARNLRTALAQLGLDGLWSRERAAEWWRVHLPEGEAKPEPT